MTTQTGSPHWIDTLVAEVLDWQTKHQVNKLHVDDMKTPSGRVHVGSLRGVVLHDLVAKVLATKTDQPVTSTYVINDLDGMTKIPSYLDTKKYQPYIDKPLCQIPAPQITESGIDTSHIPSEEKKKLQEANSYAQLYAFDFIHAFRYLGCSQEIVWSHQLYESGQMNGVIKTSLDKAQVIKDIYTKVAEYDLPTNWYPFKSFDKDLQSKKTLTQSWDGQKVEAVSLDKDGQELKRFTTSPFDGSGKLMWKIDWPAHWQVMGVTIEGSGKDHTSAGGSRDMANAFCEQVFNSIIPFDIPYEWILVRGAKMSSSKGVGTSAREFVQLFPPAVGRFLFTNKHFNQVIDFDPATMAVPDLFDDYDQAAQIFWGQETGDQRLARSFELAQVGAVPKPYFLPRYRDVAGWMQYPEKDLEAEFTKIKGSALTKKEIAELELRKKHAQIWLDNYAPSEFQLTPRANVSYDTSSLTADQKEFVIWTINQVLNKKWPDPQELQQAIFTESKNGIGPKQAFTSIYQVLLGKTHGPRAAWLLLNTPKEILHNCQKQLSVNQPLT
ncbi:lysine--tRNA ligase [Patescibacteria group bacterium]|nr:lysine--tRNA ligase [Patescibacteria group bacterium]